MLDPYGVVVLSDGTIRILEADVHDHFLSVMQPPQGLDPAARVTCVSLFTAPLQFEHALNTNLAARQGAPASSVEEPDPFVAAVFMLVCYSHGGIQIVRLQDLEVVFDAGGLAKGIAVVVDRQRLGSAVVGVGGAGAGGAADGEGRGLPGTPLPSALPPMVARSESGGTPWAGVQPGAAMHICACAVAFLPQPTFVFVLSSHDVLVYTGRPWASYETRGSFSRSPDGPVGVVTTLTGGAASTEGVSSDSLPKCYPHMSGLFRLVRAPCDVSQRVKEHSREG